MITVFVLCFLVTACASLSQESYVRPAIKTPATWTGKTVQNGKWPAGDWWKRFKSPELDQLISVAQSNNYDLKAAAARVAQARANTRIARAGLFPTVSGSAAAARLKSGDSSSVSRYDIGPQLGYEIDIWGKNRFTLDAAKADLLSTTYGGDVVRLSLTADVAASYFQLLSLNDRLRVARENLANARSLLELVQIQHRVGKVSGLELERQLTEVSSTEAAIPPLMQQIQVTRDALAVLLGASPDEIKIQADSLRTLPLPPVNAGVPSDLLERRPDISKAEMDLVSQSANISAARAALFPSISLTGQGGFTSTALSSLFNPGSIFYSVGANLLGRIFDGGRLSAQVDVAKARKEELIAVYQQSIISAFRDVEDALSGIQYFSEQETALKTTAEHAREAYRIAEMAYRLGSTDFTTVLDAQRTLLSAEAAIDPVLLNRFVALVGLYRALGGGWEDPSG